MKSNSTILGLSLMMLTLVACQNTAKDPYISPCEKALKRGAKLFSSKYDNGDKASATALCICRSRGLQSVLSVQEYDGLIRATKSGKAKMFRVIEQKYLNDLYSNNPNIKGLGSVTRVCWKYSAGVRESYYRKKEPPTLPY